MMEQIQFEFFRISTTIMPVISPMTNTPRSCITGVSNGAGKAKATTSLVWPGSPTADPLVRLPSTVVPTGWPLSWDPPIWPLPWIRITPLSWWNFPVNFIFITVSPERFWKNYHRSSRCRSDGKLLVVKGSNATANLIMDSHAVRSSDLTQRLAETNKTVIWHLNLTGDCKLLSSE